MGAELSFKAQTLESGDRIQAVCKTYGEQESSNTVA